MFAELQLVPEGGTFRTRPRLIGATDQEIEALRFLELSIERRNEIVLALTQACDAFHYRLPEGTC